MPMPTFPTRLAALIAAGLLPADRPLSHAVHRPPSGPAKVCLCPHHVSPHTALPATAPAAELAAELDAEGPDAPRLCECATWHGSPIEGLVTADVEPALAWLEVMHRRTRPNLAARPAVNRLVDIRWPLASRPAGSGHRGLDAVVEDTARAALAYAEELAADPEILDDRACALLRAARRCAGTLPKAPSWATCPPVPPWETSEDRSTDPPATIAALSRNSAWIDLAAPERRWLWAHVPEFDPAEGNLARLPALLLSGAYVNAVLCLDRGYTASEVARARKLAADPADVEPLIVALRAAG